MSVDIIKLLLQFLKAYLPVADLHSPNMNLAILIVTVLHELIKANPKNQLSLMDADACAIFNFILTSPLAAATEDKRVALKVPRFAL